MTEQQFDARLRQIDESYNLRREGADAYRDQEIARLFNECEWKQERIAAKMGRSQGWVSLRLVFARFLIFITQGNKSCDQLTEKVFRALYKGTHGTETERFAHVVTKLSDTLPVGHQHQTKKSGFRSALIESMEDGKWWMTPQIQAALAETFPGISLEVAANTVRSLTVRPPSGKQMQVKKIGKRCQYRLCSAASSASITPEVFAHIVEGIAPIIDELKHWGRSHEYQMSPVAIKRIAIQLEKLMEPLLSRVSP